MLFNHLKIAFRNIKHHKIFSFINITGLAIGLSCCLLILLWVKDELNFERFHENADNLYLVTFATNGSTVTPTALGPHLAMEYPEIINTSRYAPQGRNLLQHDKKEIYEEGGVMTDPDFIKMFTISFLSGSGENALDDPNSILLSETLALKLFGTTDPIGRMVTYNTRFPLEVKGVFRDYPSNSHLSFEYIIPLELTKNWNRNFNTWDVNNIKTYVQLDKSADVLSVNSKIAPLAQNHRPQETRPLFLQGITRLHLDPFRGHGTITYVYLFSALALFILLIACINFINLTTARSAARAKEVGIRKTVGADFMHLVRQFFGESFLLVFISLVIGLALTILCLPLFNNLTGKEFSWVNLFQRDVVVGLIALFIITIGISGSYPSFILSRFQPVQVLKGKSQSSGKGSLFRKILVVCQFSLSILLILGTVLVYRQVHYLQQRDVGYDRENLVIFRIGGQFTQNRERIRTELLSNPNIVNMTLLDIAPYRWQSNAGIGGVQWEGKTGQQVKMVMTCVDYYFLETFGLEMAAGRFFSREHKTDQTDAYVINEAAAKAMEMENPVGKQLTVWNSSRRIIGVVKDYHFESLHNRIIPMAMRIEPNGYQQACVRISPHNIPGTLSILQNKWKELYPRYPFEYSFLDDTLQSQYRSERQIGKIVTIFTVFALLISCLGIFALSSFTAERKTKEIGIRKVLGATVSSVIRKISGEFILLVLIANAIAWPIAAVLMNRWLQTFAYRVSIGWLTFALAGAAVLLISLLTIGKQIIQAASANPVDSLRYE
ncbi:MAG: ABC transporter permease [Candidatus Aminicenantes bacterium]|nr:ABC transporter permease [Candidatus Aminicenantes bacterium]